MEGPSLACWDPPTAASHACVSGVEAAALQMSAAASVPGTIMGVEAGCAVPTNPDAGLLIVAALLLLADGDTDEICKMGPAAGVGDCCCSLPLSLPGIVLGVAGAPSSLGLFGRL